MKKFKEFLEVWLDCSDEELEFLNNELEIYQTDFHKLKERLNNDYDICFDVIEFHILDIAVAKAKQQVAELYPEHIRAIDEYSVNIHINSVMSLVDDIFFGDLTVLNLHNPEEAEDFKDVANDFIKHIKE